MGDNSREPLLLSLETFSDVSPEAYDDAADDQKEGPRANSIPTGASVDTASLRGSAMWPGREEVDILSFVGVVACSKIDDLRDHG